MNITVFGANGKVGSQVVSLLLEQGCSVVAFVHGSSRLTPNEKLVIFKGDVHNYEDVSGAIADSGAVISTLGSWGTTSKDILTTGMTNIIPAMESQGVKRIVSLTGSDAWTPDEHVGLLRKMMHVVIGVGAGKILKDGENHIALLSLSSLSWTVIRSPIMKTGINSYRLSDNPPAPYKTVDREAVAQALVDIVISDEYSRTSPFITNN